MKAIRSMLAGYRRFFVQVLHFSHGERLLLGASVLLTILAAVTEAFSFGLLIPIMESAQNLAGFNSIPLLRWFSGLFGGLTSTEKLVWAAASLLVLTLLRGALLYAAEIASYSLPPRVESRIKMRVFASLYRMPVSHVEGIAAGELANLTAGNPARVGITVRFVQLLSANIVIVMINTVFMAIISPVVTLAMMLVLGVLTVAYKRMSSPALARAGSELTQSTSDFSQLFYNTINGMRLVRLSGASAQAESQVEKAVTDLRGANLRRLSVEATVFPFFSTSIGVLFCAVLIMAAGLGLGDNAKLMATMVATIYLMSRLLGPVTLINVSRINIAANMDAFDSLEQFLRTAPLHHERDGDVELNGVGHELRFEHVSFTYPNQDKLALRDLNLSLKKGERLGLVGLSGSGKSTVVGLLTRIYRPDSGRVQIDGIDLEHVRIESWWRRIAVVMQDMVLMRDSIRNNLIQGLDPSPPDAETWRALETADVDSVIKSLPQGLDTVLADRGIGLSGGERQRLSLARALLRKPDLLILDEATSNLDVQSEARIVSRLAERYPAVSMLVIAHRLGAVQTCDRVLVMCNGCVTQEIKRDERLREGFPDLKELLPADAS